MSSARRRASAWTVSRWERRTSGSGSREQQQLREPDDARERRAQLVRHRRHQLVLEALGLALGGDLADDGGAPEPLAARAAHRRAVALEDAPGLGDLELVEPRLVGVRGDRVGRGQERLGVGEARRDVGRLERLGLVDRDAEDRLGEAVRAAGWRARRRPVVRHQDAVADGVEHRAVDVGEAAARAWSRARSRSRSRPSSARWPRGARGARSSTVPAAVRPSEATPTTRSPYTQRDVDLLAHGDLAPERHRRAASPRRGRSATQRALGDRAAGEPVAVADEPRGQRGGVEPERPDELVRALAAPRRRRRARRPARRRPRPSRGGSSSPAPAARRRRRARRRSRRTGAGARSRRRARR